MNWVAIAAVAIAPAVIGFLGGLWTSARQRGGIRETIRAEFAKQEAEHAHEVSLDSIAAARAFASKLDEHFRPHVAEVLRVARVVTTACHARDAGIGDDDVARLDECIDHFESSPATQALGEACVELRVKAVQYRAAIRHQRELVDGMPGARAPLDPDQGRRVVAHGERLDHLVNATTAAAAAVRSAVKDFTSELEERQTRVSP